MTSLETLTCPRCAKRIDAATNIEATAPQIGEGQPAPGAFCVCMYCGAVLCVTPEYTLRPVEAADLEDLSDVTRRQLLTAVMTFDPWRAKIEASRATSTR